MTIFNPRKVLIAGGLCLLAACSADAQGNRQPVRPQPGKASPEVETMYPNACYQGIDPEKDVCLKNGRSEGPPVVVLGPERGMGDLDADGTPETALLLTGIPEIPSSRSISSSPPGRGTDRQSGDHPAGQSGEGEVDEGAGGKLHLEGSRSASARTAMMPVTLTFSLRQGKLVEESRGAADVRRAADLPRLRLQHRAVAQLLGGGGEGGVGEDLVDALHRLHRVADALVEHHLAVEVVGEDVQPLDDRHDEGPFGVAAQVLGAVGRASL